MTDEVRGLKIPRSSVTDVTFYVIPKDYYVSGKKDSSDTSTVSQSGFRKETYADGKTVGVVTPCTIYYADDEYYYVDAGENSELKAAVIRYSGELRFFLRMMNITRSKRERTTVCPSTTTLSLTRMP